MGTRLQKDAKPVAAGLGLPVAGFGLCAVASGASLSKLSCELARLRGVVLLFFLNNTGLEKLYQPVNQL